MLMYRLGLQITEQNLEVHIFRPKNTGRQSNIIIGHHSSLEW